MAKPNDTNTPKKIRCRQACATNALEKTLERYSKQNYELRQILSVLIQKFGKPIDDEYTQNNTNELPSPKLIEINHKEYDNVVPNLHEPNIFLNKTKEGYTVSYADDMHIISISGCGTEIVTNMYNSSKSTKRYEIKDLKDIL